MDPQAERIAEVKRATDAKVQAKLDAVHDRFSGPYKVKGEQAPVPARPMFRMNVPDTLSAKNAEDHKNELVKICKKAGIPGNVINNARVGRPTPQELVKVTQALIDAGKLPDADATLNTVEKRIRQMQFDWGIGVDCAGYVREAAVAVHGNGAQPLVNGANRSGAIHSILQTPAFKKVAFKEDADPRVHNIRDIRTGDIIHLDSKNPKGVGHNAIVHSHEVATDSRRDELWDRAKRSTDLLTNLVTGTDVDGFFCGKGPFHVLNVDSSWGVDPAGVEHGGFRRDMWVYDESTGKWGTFLPGRPVSPDQPVFITSQTGPYNHVFKDAFRPASEK
ncbi:MAG: hypothetical protein FWD73_03625 [Polyangiaceae bacterium]|nr:hypothetical protein [Polyangiaceae bacterium]